MGLNKVCFARAQPISGRDGAPAARSSSTTSFTHPCYEIQLTVDKPPPVAIYSSISRSGDKFQENTQRRWDESCQKLSRLWLYKPPGTSGCPRLRIPSSGKKGIIQRAENPWWKKGLDERKACPTLPPGGGKLQHTTHSCFSTQEGEQLQGKSYAHHFQAPSVKIPVGSGELHPAVTLLLWLSTRVLGLQPQIADVFPSADMGFALPGLCIKWFLRARLSK